MDDNRKQPLHPGAYETLAAAARVNKELPQRPGANSLSASLPGSAALRTPIAARPIQRPGSLPPPPQVPGLTFPRPVARAGNVYRGLPAPVKTIGWFAVAFAVALVVGATAPTAFSRIAAVLAVQPGLLAWYCVRALGFLAYGVLAGSVLYGLLLSTKILDVIAHRPVSFALHKDLSIAALIVGTVHGLLLTLDQSYNFTLVSILVPFQSPYAPLAVGVGQLTLYTAAVVTATFYVRRQIGQRTWRTIHYITFLVFIGSTVHGISSGSDSGTPWAFWIYLLTATATIFLTTYRIVISVAAHASAPSTELFVPYGTRPAQPGPLDRPGARSGGYPWPS
jgi:DMSO/TMAO reductase YedYZ heme-binding membrane subunit